MLELSPQIIQREILRVLWNYAGVFSRDECAVLTTKSGKAKTPRNYNSFSPLATVSELEPKNVLSLENSGEEDAV